MEMMLPAFRDDIGIFEVRQPGSRSSVLTPAGNVTRAEIWIPPTSTNLVRADQHAGMSRRNRRKWKKQRKARKERRRRRKHKKRKHGSRRRPTNGVVFLRETPTLGTRGIGIGAFPSPTQARMAMCDFIEYTLRLQRCLRTFFFALQLQPQNCGTLYTDLEACVLFAASSCVPSRDMTSQRVEEIVFGSLRSNFKTKQVYCEEEGAFVFPKFAVDKLPIQCGPRYFIKLSECGGPFRNIFNIQHGNPRLCSEYYQANECQRQ
uniref:Uncharacterized protein n=1 Tax=Ciona savignyi TaxID=51511 RepID=H2YMD9_CIOSA